MFGIIIGQSKAMDNGFFTQITILALSTASAVAITYAFSRMRHMKQQQQTATELEVTKSQLEDSRNDVDDLKEQLMASEERRQRAENENARVNQAFDDLKAEVENAEKKQAELLKTTKAAMFESGTDIFRKEAEQFNQKTLNHFQQVVEKVSVLNDRVTKSGETVETVWKSLSTPHAVGSFSEIGLENTLKQYGLKPNLDFTVQYHVAQEGGNLRPDAIVFLPENDVLVIDSKASIAFLELAKAETEHEKKTAEERVKKRMNEHLKKLSEKGYRDAVEKSYFDAGKKNRIRHIRTAMFLHAESYVEQLYKLDPDLWNKGIQHDIIITGPAGLGGILSSTRFSIAAATQAENHEVIIYEISQLLGGLETVLKHTSAVGTSLRSVAKNYSNLTKSVNRTLLPKANKITNLGVSLPKNKPLPNKLSSVHLVEDSETIEGESTSVDSPSRSLIKEEV